VVRSHPSREYLLAVLTSCPNAFVQAGLTLAMSLSVTGSGFASINPVGLSRMLTVAESLPPSEECWRDRAELCSGTTAPALLHGFSQRRTAALGFSQ
jgi:hypothetical protein